MKAKKLTKREWYLCAHWWLGDFKASRSLLSMATSLSWKEAVASIGSFQEEIDGDYENRRCFYSQYCLERAGIPAGDR